MLISTYAKKNVNVFKEQKTDFNNLIQLINIEKFEIMGLNFCYKTAGMKLKEFSKNKAT